MRATLNVSLFAAALVGMSAHASLAQEVKTLSPADLAIQTTKWQGKMVETTFRCFYADKDEFRCIAGRTRVDFSALEPAEARTTLENKCDTVEGLAKNSQCVVKIRFEYEDSEIKDNNGSRLTVVSAKDSKGEIIPTGKKKR